MSDATDMIYCNVQVALLSMTPPTSGGQFYTVQGKMTITEQTPSPDPAQPYFKIPVGNTLVVNVPADTPLRVQYTVVPGALSGGPYILNGIYFTQTPAGDPCGNNGFPLVTLAREAVGKSSVKMNSSKFDLQPSTMNVVDCNDYSGYYRYVLVIQDVGANIVGTFDPGYDNEN